MVSRASKRKVKQVQAETDACTRAKGSAPAALHASVDPLAFYADILPMVPVRPGSVILDIGGSAEIDRLCLRARFGHATRLFGTVPIPDPAGRSLANGKPMMWEQRILTKAL